MLPRAPRADVAAAPPLVSSEHAAPHLSDSQHFTIDPVVDGLLVVGGITFDEILSAILSTGEIKPQAPGDPSKLLSIDRWAVTQTIDPNAATRSNIGLYMAYGYAVLDPILSGVRDGRRAFLVDAVMYAESLAVTGAFTEATKIGVRRPRPIDYANCGTPEQAQTSFCTSNTDLQLSFFSGHASATGAVTGTATYVAFVRSGPRSPRPWITLGVGTALTTFVSYERVRAGEHFPTDVIMGSLVGAGIGVLVPHFHRRPHYHDRELEEPPVIVGYAPVHGGGSLTAEWRF
jgi:undecaprenyl-diphosphatase